MTWFERYCVTWSAMAIAFSLGCIARNEVGSQIESVLHTACMTAHSGVALFYVCSGLLRLREAKREQGEVR